MRQHVFLDGRARPRLLRPRLLRPGLLMMGGAVLWLFAPGSGGAAAPSEEVRQPRNIYELLYSIDHTFKNILKEDDWKQFRTQSPEQIRQKDPDLYQRISQDVRLWTDQWIQHVRTSLVPIPEKRLNAAEQKARQVDGILKTHFDARGWPYKSLRAVFLPPQVFLDERHREMLTSGMFIPFYPEAFFVSVDWPVAMELVLVHESLHFNQIGTPFGGPLLEGITETGARYLVLKYELVTPYAVKLRDTYKREREGVDLLLDEIQKRTAGDRDQAVELFLGAYLTGNQDGMNRVFGAETWARILKLSKSQGDWQTHRIKKALEE